MGFSLYFPNLAKTVKEHFPAHFIGKATGIYTTAIPLGAGVGIALTKPLLAATGSWQKVMGVWSIMALFILALCAIAVSRCRGAARGPFQPAPAPSQEGPKNSMDGDPLQGGPPVEERKDRLPLPMIICGLLLAILNVIFYATLGWLPTYLTEEGWSLASAAAVTSMISFVEVPAVLLVPILSDRTGRRKIIILACFFLIALCAVLVSLAPSWSWAAAPVLGITFGAPFALLLAFPAQFSRHEKVGSAAGLVLSIGYAGALLGPPLAGYVRDITGAFSIGFLGMAGAALLAALLSLALPDSAGRARS
ncbi:MAG: MFS transporter [Desulfobacterales bacterium]|nr:MFS transporter [Desulfobacterales bacterium]